jgi:predicted nucleic acid-binding protein
VLRLVIDTSSLVSYALTQGELMRRIVAHWQAGTFTLLSSPGTRAELASVLARPSIRQLATGTLLSARAWNQGPCRCLQRSKG